MTVFPYALFLFSIFIVGIVSSSEVESGLTTWSVDGQGRIAKNGISIHVRGASIAIRKFLIPSSSVTRYVMKYTAAKKRSECN